MKFLHSMIRIKSLEESKKFFINKLGLSLVSEKEYPEGKFSLVFLKAKDSDALIELTYNWEGEEEYSNGRNFGHLAFGVDNINDYCQKLQEQGVTILRPPRDGHMAFIKSPDGISIEILQLGERLKPVEPWISMKSTGEW